MNRTDLKSYSDAKSGKLWRYGFEAWCNLEGRFVTLVGDLSHMENQYYEQTLCALGIFGVEYVRDADLPRIVEVVHG